MSFGFDNWEVTETLKGRIDKRYGRVPVSSLRIALDFD